MSYCRFAEGDVYAYECDGGVQFWVACEANRGLDHLCNTYNEAYQYAKSLRDEHSLDVPDYAIEALRSDALEEVKRFNGPNSAVAELQAENVQLRTQLADVTESIGRVEERCAKLRELAKKLKACNSSCGRCIELFGKCDYETELRERGIEVSE